MTWYQGRAYGVSYNIAEETWSLKLLRGDDGVHYEVIAELRIPGRPNETTLRFFPNGEMMALVRREGDNKYAWIGASMAPYTAWSWHETKHRVGGPNFVVLPDGQLWAAGRDYTGETKTVLARFGRDTYEPVLTLPSGGDTSYPGLAWYQGMLWISYYASHEGKASIYLAKVKLP